MARLWGTQKKKKQSMTYPSLPYEAESIINLLGLKPHPEGGYYRETFRDNKTDTNGHSVSTAIYFLIIENQSTRWHKINASEIWHWYAGSPLKLFFAPPHDSFEEIILGFNLQKCMLPQYCIPAGWWQKASTMGAWTLVGCTVAPGFRFEELVFGPENQNPPF